MKFLVADDDATSRLLAEVALRSLGHECQTVADGAQAWAAFQAERPDVVISDLRMPELTGLDLCRRIRAAPGLYTYFIMVTSQGALGEILEGMSAGADDYLVKPLDHDALQARLVAAERVTSLHTQLADQRAELEGLNLELTTIARRDQLTGLGNRRALAEDLEFLEARVIRYGHRYCMGLLDIDHFKAYNDTYGHLAGDQALEAVADRLGAEVRGGDALYRYGGEEFLFIFPEQSLATGTLAMERMRTSVERLAIPHTGSPSGVLTVTAGMAILEAGYVTRAIDVLKQADEALYRGKQLGRNRVEQPTASRR